MQIKGCDLLDLNKILIPGKSWKKDYIWGNQERLKGEMKIFITFLSRVDKNQLIHLKNDYF